MGDAWIGVAGMALGVALTQGFNLWTEHTRWKREDRHRFHQEKRLVYVKYRAIETWIALANSGSPGFAEKVEEALLADSEIRILGDKKVMEAARKLSFFVGQHLNSTADMNELAEFLTAFDDAARDAIAP